MDINIYKKNKDGYVDLIYPEKIRYKNDDHQIENNIKCQLCEHIPVIYEIIKNMNVYYICYNCSKSEMLMNYHFGAYANQILKIQKNSYP